jgi:hypothetical protein
MPYAARLVLRAARKAVLVSATARDVGSRLLRDEPFPLRKSYTTPSHLDVGAADLSFPKSDESCKKNRHSCGGGFHEVQRNAAKPTRAFMRSTAHIDMQHSPLQSCRLARSAYRMACSADPTCGLGESNSRILIAKAYSAATANSPRASTTITRREQPRTMLRSKPSTAASATLL